MRRSVEVRSPVTYRTIDLAELVRVHALRAPRLMWLLGAGVSAASGIPTAGQLVDEFKRLLYCSEVGVNRRLVDMAEPAAAHKVQAYFDADPRFPPVNSIEEYSAYFELAMPAAKDRRAFLQERLLGRQPSYGHVALAVLMAMQKCRLVWTTNFDPLLADAAAHVFESTSILTTVEPETAARVAAISEERYPIEVKLHGDFRSELLKNTEAELQAQDHRLRSSLVAEARRGGLLVLGYSGRDASVMEALGAALDAGEAFPDGLYWCHFGAAPPIDPVVQLLDRATASGVDACLVPSGTADEVLGRVLDVLDVPDGLRGHLDRRQPDRRWSPMRLPPLAGTWPRVRLNALRLEAFPHTCRVVECEIGGAAEVRRAIETASADIVATRRSDGVIAFGSDAEVDRCFEPFDVKSLDVAQIDVSRLWRERSADLAVLYDAMVRALERGSPVERHRFARGQHLLAVRADADTRSPGLQRLGAAAGGLTGVHAIGFRWAEAIRLRLEHRFGVLWLVYEPTVWAERVEDSESAAQRTEFLRERQATRYNRAWAQLLDGWSEVLRGGQERRTVSAFDLVGDPGVNATFTLVAGQPESRERRRSRR